MPSHACVLASACVLRHLTPPRIAPPHPLPQNFEKALFKKTMVKLRQGDLMPLVPLGVGALLAIALQLFFSRTAKPPAKEVVEEAKEDKPAKASRRSKMRKVD